MKIPLVHFFTFLLIMGQFTSWGQSKSSLVELTQQMENQPPGFAQLTSHFHKYVDDGVMAGTVIMMKKGDQLLMDKYGLQSIEEEKPMEYNTLFRLASMTKPITSVAVMMLVEEGKIRLDDPVEKYIPSFKKLGVYETEATTSPLERPLTIQHLLSHTGGITSGFDPSPAGQLSAKMIKAAEIKSLEELITTLSEIPLANQPVERWVYGYSTDVLAYVVEQVTGRGIEDFFKKRIFNPLKMNDTGFQMPKEKWGRFASLYATGKDGQLVLADAPKDSPYTNGTYFPRGNGGLVSSPTDYFRFCQMLLNGGELEGVRLLKKETIELMSKNHLPKELIPIGVAGNKMTGQGFGLGFGVLMNDAPFGTEGDFFWPGAAFTYFYVSPKNGTIGLFMTQLSDFTIMHLIGEFHGLAGNVFDKTENGKKSE